MSAPSRRAYKVTMVCWTLEDDFVVTSGSDHALVVWDPSNGRLVRQLEGHKEDTYVLIAHPLYREYVFSAGHDGLFMVCFFPFFWLAECLSFHFIVTFRL